MKTIAIVSSYWRNSPGGGVLTYLTGLFEELSKRDVRVKVVFELGNDPDNFRIKGHRFLFPIKAFWPLIKIRPDVVHSQGAWYCLMAGFLYKTVRRARLIHTFHSAPGDTRLPAGGRVVIQFLLNRCDYVTFDAKALQQEIEDRWGLKVKNTVITHGGVKPREVTRDEINQFRKQFGLRDNNIVLLAQALTANKLKAEGARLLIKSVVILKNKYPDIVLILTREGGFSNELKKSARELGIDDSVIFTGDVANPYIPLAVCDIFTHISLSEGGPPLALLEAMSVRKPVIATSVGDISDVIQHMENGILVSPDINEIAGQVERLLLDKNLAVKLGKNAGDTIARKFTWELAADRFMKIYEGRT